MQRMKPLSYDLSRLAKLFSETNHSMHLRTNRSVNLCSAPISDAALDRQPARLERREDAALEGREDSGAIKKSFLVHLRISSGRCRYLTPGGYQ